MSEKPTYKELEQRVRDLEQAQAESILIEPKPDLELLKALIETLHDEVWFCDADGNIVLANTAAVMGFGFESAEEDHKPIQELLSQMEIYTPDKKPCIPGDAPVLRSLRGEILTGIEDIVRHPKTGKRLHRKIRSAPIKTEAGQIIGAVVVIRDDTDRKLAEQALRRSEERYRSVVEDQTEVISRFMADGTFTFVNETYCKFFGKNESDLIGNYWHPVVHKEDLPKINHQLQELSIDNPIAIIENRVYSGDGCMRWMQFVNRGLFDNKGQLVEIQSVGRDITQLKEHEQLILLREKEIQDKADELKNINIALEVLLAKRNRQIEEFKENSYRNFNNLILPDLNNLKKRLKLEPNKKSISLIIRNFENLFSSDTDHLTSERFGLTKTELKIAAMIRNDMKSTEIAEHLFISTNTVSFHRKNLRKKLGIYKSEENLSKYLDNLS